MGSNEPTTAEIRMWVSATTGTHVGNRTYLNYALNRLEEAKENYATLVKTYNQLFSESEIEVERRIKAEDKLKTAEGDLGSKQATIDALMFEYCPDDMTREQVSEWARNQRFL